MNRDGSATPPGSATQARQTSAGNCLAGHCRDQRAGPLGGGLELALKCDLRIVAADAQLGLPEIQFGALPTGGGMIRLPRLVGISAAKLMVLSGEPVSGIQAYRMGLADAVAEGPVLQAAMELATRMARRPRYALLLS